MVTAVYRWSRVGKTAFIEDVFVPFYRQTGVAMSAFNAWVMLKSLETLALRVEMQTKTAKQLTENIKHHPAVLSLSYPGIARILNMSWHHVRCQGLVPCLPSKSRVAEMEHSSF